jgi:hypothetical protein
MHEKSLEFPNGPVVMRHVLNFNNLVRNQIMEFVSEQDSVATPGLSSSTSISTTPTSLTGSNVFFSGLWVKSFRLECEVEAGEGLLHSDLTSALIRIVLAQLGAESEIGAMPAWGDDWSSFSGLGNKELSPGRIQVVLATVGDPTASPMTPPQVTHHYIYLPSTEIS